MTRKKKTFNWLTFHVDACRIIFGLLKKGTDTHIAIKRSLATIAGWALFYFYLGNYDPFRMKIAACRLYFFCEKAVNKPGLHKLY
ncbi:hypothetical protein D1B31_11710 [Neobacillus notoginsengisoli]|uniref:Uncharacterized protein n=1 Tax=Neobacillus notoginsengisoli TaxID=1578198 RepID=A0A417YT57_9BACI|nr:hypothetical protein D1B31_11710 [Neobacillus notoginsengisoli]